MAEIRIRNIDAQTFVAFRDVARRQGNTVPEQVRQLITEAAIRPRQELMARLDRLKEGIRAEHGILPDSTPIIREERDRIG